MPDPLGTSFLQALSAHRFRTIENAASEQTSVGWVTQGDPSGNTFDREDMDRDRAVWLRLRIDKKKAPTRWLQIHRQSEEKAAGRKLDARERKEMREDLLAKLLPRVLPTINLVDVLYLPESRLLLLFATANGVREEFLSLFYRTFAVSLAAADPHRLALSLDLGGRRTDALHDLAPVRWPSAGPRHLSEVDPAAARAAATEAREEVGA